MAEDDEHIDVEENSNLPQNDPEKNKHTYTKVSTSEDSTVQSFETFDISNQKGSSLSNLKYSISNWISNHKLGLTIACWEDSMGNPRIIIGPDCK